MKEYKVSIDIEDTDVDSPESLGKSLSDFPIHMVISGVLYNVCTEFSSDFEDNDDKRNNFAAMVRTVASVLFNVTIRDTKKVSDKLVEEFDYVHFIKDISKANGRKKLQYASAFIHVVYEASNELGVSK